MAIYYRSRTIKRIHQYFTNASKTGQPGDMQFYIDVNVFDVHIRSVRKDANLFQNLQDYELLVNSGPSIKSKLIYSPIGFTQIMNIDLEKNRFVLTNDGERIKEKDFKDFSKWLKYKQKKRIRRIILQWIKSNTYYTGTIIGALIVGIVVAVGGGGLLELLKDIWFPDTGLKLKGK